METEIETETENEMETEMETPIETEMETSQKAINHGIGNDHKKMDSSQQRRWFSPKMFGMELLVVQAGAKFEEMLGRLASDVADTSTDHKQNETARQRTAIGQDNSEERLAECLGSY